jgi:hypothetical protein
MKKWKYLMKDKDGLQEIFAMQRELMLRYKENDPTFPQWPIDFSNKAQQKFVRDTLINAADELFEATRTLKNYKQHRQTEILDFNKEDFLEEIVDATKFVIEALILSGINEREFMNAHITKNNVCHMRLDEKY